MFDNFAIASGFSFLEWPIKFATCSATQRKVLPYALLQLFSGITILVMVAFPNSALPISAALNSPIASGKIFCAHVANVLVSAALGILSPITIDSFPKKYR